MTVFLIYFLDCCLVYARIFSLCCNYFHLAVVCFENLWPLGPWIVFCTFNRRLWHHFKGNNICCPQTNTSTCTVIASVTATNDDYMFSLWIHVTQSKWTASLYNFLCYGCKEINCRIDAHCIFTGNIKFACLLCTAAESNGIKFLKEFVSLFVCTDICIAYEFNAFSLHKVNAAVNDFLIKFHVWNSVHKKSTNMAFAFKNSNAVSAAVQQICNSKTCRT